MATGPALPFIDLAAQRARLGARIDDAIAAVLAHGQYILGPEIAELEGALAEIGGSEVVTCASGSDALVMAYLALGIEPGEAVVVPAFTFAATAGSAALLGIVPVFADVDETTRNLDPESAARAVKTATAAGLKVRAIVPVDLYGQPADYSALEAVAREAGSLLVADAAQSFGASQHGRPVGSLAPVTTLSFFPSKPLGCYGDGGALITDDPALAAVLRSIRNHGEGSHRYEHVRVGINGRLDSLQAAILLAKLTVFSDELEERQRVADLYNALLPESVVLPHIVAGNTSAWAQYTIEVDDRDAVIGRLAAAGIPTAVHYPTAAHRQPVFSGYPVVDGGAPVSERLATRVLSLPMHPYLDAATQERIATEVTAAVA